LNDKYVTATNILVKFDGYFAVREFPYRGITKREA
jgi:hypothetical protein